MERGVCTDCFRVRDSSYGKAYRVLLTRARQGIIICIPKGNSRQTPEGFPEHEAAKWLNKEQLNSVDWLPADRTIIEQIKTIMV